MKQFLLTILLLCAASVFGQKPDSVLSEPTVSLLTCAPGCEIYELEGHTGLRLRTDSIDIVANWGLFDFASPNFVYRFVKGETDYMAGICPTELFLAQYIYEKRRVTEQVLNLTPTQANRVMELVMENCAPQNRVYRYNYVRNNCATKPVAVIEAVVGEPIEFGVPAQACENDTWRTVMSRYHKNYPWYQFGIDLALGNGIDFPITNREQMFAPQSLMEMMANATITDSSGTRKPLVMCTNILTPGDACGTVRAATPWYMTPLFWGCVLLIITAIASWRNITSLKFGKWFDSIFYSVLGLDGLIIAFLVFVSVHEATTPNYLILWINPLCLLVPILMWNKKGRSTLYIYQWLNLCAIISFAATWMFGIQSGNAAFAPIMLADAIRAVTYIYIYKRFGTKA